MRPQKILRNHFFRGVSEGKKAISKGLPPKFYGVIRTAGKGNGVSVERVCFRIEVNGNDLYKGPPFIYASREDIERVYGS